MAREPSPTVSRRRLAAELRRLREDAQKTGTQVAQVLDGSSSKISRMEKAQVIAHKDDVALLADFYDVSPSARAALLALAEESEGKGWWEAFGDSLNESYMSYIGLEAGADSMLTWQNVTVPGLLQTVDYARSVIGLGHSLSAIPPAEVERLVRVRMRRQQMLEGPSPLVVNALIDESVLHRRFGTPEVMRDQLRHILEVAQLPNVSVRIVPLDGPHGPLTHAFVLLKFPSREGLDSMHEDLVYFEHATGAVFEERYAETYRVEQLFRQMSADALSEEDSLKLLGELGR
ncbi:DUF5753 domain-containing protein [Nonomuraea sp. NPDC003804]|uniref:DUF5753 domain-containing protein n=1 Tax=Nonomuraea sp. NPDC003804 TaxID=3154547 RepID=UPI0033B77942